jgi:hypothetical protein
VELRQVEALAIRQLVCELVGKRAIHRIAVAHSSPRSLC